MVSLLNFEACLLTCSMSGIKGCVCPCLMEHFRSRPEVGSLGLHHWAHIWICNSGVRATLNCVPVNVPHPLPGGHKKCGSVKVHHCVSAALAFHPSLCCPTGCTACGEPGSETPPEPGLWWGGRRDGPQRQKPSRAVWLPVPCPISAGRDTVLGRAAGAIRIFLLFMWGIWVFIYFAKWIIFRKGLIRLLIFFSWMWRENISPRYEEDTWQKQVESETWNRQFAG